MGMDRGSIGERIVDLQKKIVDLEKKTAGSEAIVTQHMEQIKKEFGCSTLKEAKVLMTKLTGEKEQLEKEALVLLEELEEYCDLNENH